MSEVCLFMFWMDLLASAFITVVEPSYWDKPGRRVASAISGAGWLIGYAMLSTVKP
mgnify:FL=1